VLSRALGCPFTLPLHPLLEVPDAAQLPALQPVLLPGERQPLRLAHTSSGGLQPALPRLESCQAVHVEQLVSCIMIVPHGMQNIQVLFFAVHSRSWG
jgi:hypothetical protein